MLRAAPQGMLRCRRCGLIYRDPLAEAVSDEVSRAEAQEAGQEEWIGERRSRNFLRFLGAWAGAPGRLLDVGCGYGWFLQAARARGWEAVGVDVSREAVRYATEQLGVRALHGDLKELHFPSGSFTLVTLWNALDFVADPVGLFQEIHRVLEPGGHLFIRTPNAGFQRLAFLLTGWAGRLERSSPTFVFHLTSFSPASLRLLLKQTGFVLVRLGNSPPTWGDPYRVWGGADRLMGAVKLGVHALVQSLCFLSGGRLIVGSTLEAYARRED